MMSTDSNRWNAGRLAACACGAGRRPLCRLERAAPAPVQFVFTSDAHYGLTRAAFRGATDVPAHLVNVALVAKINRLPDARFPKTAGLRAGEPVGGLDFVVEGGDIDESRGRRPVRRGDSKRRRLVVAVCRRLRRAA